MGSRLKVLKHLNIPSGELATEWFVPLVLDTIHFGMGTYGVLETYNLLQGYSQPY